MALVSVVFWDDDGIMKRLRYDIYEYTDYRVYLKARLEELKAQDRKYSLRFLAKRLGLKSNSHLKMVMDGDHNLSESLARRLAEFLEMSEAESEFFLALVNYCQARSTQEQALALEELRRRRRFSKLHRTALDQFDYLNDVLTLTLREMVALPDFSPDPAWIAPRLVERAAPSEIEAALEKLVRLGLLQRDEAGRYTQTTPHLHTGHGFGPIVLRGYYQGAFARAAASIDLDGEERYVGGMSMAVSRATYERIVEHFNVFMDTVRREVDADEAPERVYQFVAGLSPLSRAISQVGSSECEKEAAT